MTEERFSYDAKALLLLIVNMLLATSALALTRQNQRRVDQFAEQVLAKSNRVVGNPINQDTALDDFYRWHARKKLFRVR